MTQADSKVLLPEEYKYDKRIILVTTHEKSFIRIVGQINSKCISSFGDRTFSLLGSVMELLSITYHFRYICLASCYNIAQ